MALSAIGNFYESLEDGKLPTAIIVQDSTGRTGLAAQGVPFKGIPRAERYVLSPCWRERAYAALLAINYSVQKVDNYFQDVEVVVK